MTFSAGIAAASRVLSPTLELLPAVSCCRCQPVQRCQARDSGPWVEVDVTAVAGSLRRAAMVRMLLAMTVACLVLLSVILGPDVSRAAGATNGYETPTSRYDVPSDVAHTGGQYRTVPLASAATLEASVAQAFGADGHAYDSSRSPSAPSGLADDLLGAACSFSGETHVLMADGTTKPIEDVEVGDWVLAEDPETGERGAREVTHLWVHQDTIIDLEIGGHDVAATEDHPFWDHTDNEWQRADALDAGDLVLAADGSTLTVGAVDWGSTRTTTAYNLTVNDIHTYFVGVGDDEVLVHNTNGCNLWKLTREGAESTRRHSRFGTFYETVNWYGDSMWLTTDTAQHGGSYFKMYEETSTGLRWVADLDEFGTILADKHKSDVGAFIPWKELGR